MRGKVDPGKHPEMDLSNAFKYIHLAREAARTTTATTGMTWPLFTPMVSDTKNANIKPGAVLSHDSETTDITIKCPLTTNTHFEKCNH